MLLGQHVGTGKEVHAVGHTVTDKEIGDGGHGEISNNLDQRVDLVFAAYGTDLQEGKAGMHRQYHDCAK